MEGILGPSAFRPQGALTPLSYCLTPWLLVDLPSASVVVLHQV